jgi:hypothetical protein
MVPETGGIWVTRWIERLADRAGARPAVVGLVGFGAVPVGISAAFFALAGAASTPAFVVAHTLATLVAVVGTPAIRYWERAVFARFVERTESIVDDREAFGEIAERYGRLFRRRYWTTTAVWTALVVGVVALNVEFFRTLGVSGYADPAFWAYVAFGVWFGLITGIGFHGAFVTVGCIRTVGRLEFEIEPLHPDGVGGLRSIGSFAIWTTMLISLGSLTLPLAFLMAAAGGFTPLVYVAIAAYTATIVVSFVYPTAYVYRKAQRIRAEELERRRERIRALQRETETLPEGEAGNQQRELREATKRLEIQRLRDEFDEYRSVSLYPLSGAILLRLFSSVLLPLGFLLLRLALV